MRTNIALHLANGTKLLTNFGVPENERMWVNQQEQIAYLSDITSGGDISGLENDVATLTTNLGNHIYETTSAHNISGQISGHNSSGSAHSDIRTALNNKVDKTNGSLQLMTGTNLGLD